MKTISLNHAEVLIAWSTVQYNPLSFCSFSNIFHIFERNLLKLQCAHDINSNKNLFVFMTDMLAMKIN